jgi:hypothetical protein
MNQKHQKKKSEFCFRLNPTQLEDREIGLQATDPEWDGSAAESTAIMAKLDPLNYQRHMIADPLAHLACVLLVRSLSRATVVWIPGSGSPSMQSKLVVAVGCYSSRQGGTARAVASQAGAGATRDHRLSPHGDGEGAHAGCGGQAASRFRRSGTSARGPRGRPSIHLTDRAPNPRAIAFPEL